MNCEQATELIYEITATDGRYRDDLAAHVAGCRHCKALLDKAQQTTSLLSGVPAVEAPPRLLQRAIARIEDETAPARSNMTTLGAGIGLGFAFAASLFIALFSNVLFEAVPGASDDPVSSITMAVNHQQTVNILFDSPEAVDSATIIVSLPEHIRIAGFEDRATLNWKTKLKAGKNTLSLPLVAQASGSGLLRSELQINGQSRQITLMVDVDSDLNSAIDYINT